MIIFIKQMRKLCNYLISEFKQKVKSTPNRLKYNSAEKSSLLRNSYDTATFFA